MNKILRNILLLILIPIISFSQNSSVYTRYALGDYAPFFSARNVVLGEASAFADTRSIGSTNPAAWNRINLTRVEGGFMFTQSLQQEGSLNAKYFGAKFLGIRFAVPIQRDYGIVMALFVEPVTVIDYDVVKKYNSEQFGNYSLKYQGQGGISKIGFGLTYRLPFGFALGSTFDYYSGSSNYSSTLDFPEFSQYVDATFKARNTYHGLGFSLGLVTNDFAEYFKSDFITGLNFSATVKYLAKVFIDTSIVIHSKYDEITTPGNQFTAQVPNVYILGMKIDFNKMFTFVSDYTFSDWSKFNYEHNAKVINSMKFSAGCEYFDRKHKRRTFWQNVPLRVGFFAKRMQYSVQGKNIYVYALSLGAGLPINEKDMVDFSLSIGKRGPNDGTLVQEKFVSLGVSLSFGEQWFIRRGY